MMCYDDRWPESRDGRILRAHAEQLAIMRFIEANGSADTGYIGAWLCPGITFHESDWARRRLVQMETAGLVSGHRRRGLGTLWTVSERGRAILAREG